ncbi:MAG: DUF6069 family protein [Trueperaceae bacterium]
MTPSPRSTASALQVDLRRTSVATVLAAIAAAVANALVYAVGDAFGAFPSDVIVTAGMPMTLAPIVSLSVLATLTAGAVFALLGRVATRPVRAFLIVSGVVLVVMAVPPFLIADAPALMIVALQVTHLVTAGIAVYALTRYGMRNDAVRNGVRR